MGGDVCYVLCAFTGKRIKADEYEVARDYYLTEHLRALARIETCRLSRIVIVAPFAEEEPSNFGNWLSVVGGTSLGGVRVDVLRRDNFGLSYGSLLEAFRNFPDHEWYLFVEDDYQPSQSDLVRSLVEKATVSGAEYVGQVNFTEDSHFGPHMAVSNGLISRSAVLRASKYLDDIITCSPGSTRVTPCHSTVTALKLQYDGIPIQAFFSQCFLSTGTKLTGMTATHSTIFHKEGNLGVVFGDPGLERLFEPVQYHFLGDKYVTSTVPDRGVRFQFGIREVVYE
jgi:hypothetical protein